MIRPIIAITMGDPASIGPEITIKALGGHTHLYDECKPLVIGDAEIMRRYIVCFFMRPTFRAELQPGRGTALCGLPEWNRQALPR